MAHLSALDVVFAGFKKTVMRPIYDVIRQEVPDFITNFGAHPDWLASNADMTALLMKHFMKPDVRGKLCKALEKKAPALNQDKIWFLHLVAEVMQGHRPQFLLLLLAWLSVFLKKHGNVEAKEVDFQPLCEEIMKIVKSKPPTNYSIIKESKVWQETLRLALKFGLSSASHLLGNESQHKTASASCESSTLLLQTLTHLFQHLYSCNEDDQFISMVHSMILQHSEFLNIMLSSSQSKYELIQLLQVLIELNPLVMDSSHVPVLLAAYNASMGRSDRALLKLLILYEQSGIDLSLFRPYFWGRQGANHYSIWSHGSTQNRTLFQQPRPDQVLALLDPNVIKETISKFPLHDSSNVSLDLLCKACQLFFFIYKFSWILRFD